jgi:branched-chain amino acid aminotransferase
VASVKTDKIWLDGSLLPYERATVHVLTHSLHYGLGVFEGMRCYKTDDGRLAIFRAREHIRRLFDSARILELKIPFTQEQLLRACVEVVRANALQECYLRPLVFVGEGEMGVAALNNKIRVAVAAWEWGAYLGEEGVKRGIRVKTSSFVRFHHNSMLCTAKATGHYVNSILASHEAKHANYDEALLLDVDGFVSEGAGENVFIARDGVVTTPPLSSALPGITRDAVIKILADAGISVVQRRFPRDAIYVADEFFMTGTAAEVTPVRELDDRQIGSQTPGPITSQVREVFTAALRGRDPRYRDWLYYV